MDNISRVKSSAINGAEIRSIDVEVSLTRGLPYYNIVGLADSAIKESRERVRNAIKNSGLIWPDRRITVNLSPAWYQKKGSSFDLPIALALLQATGQIPLELNIAAWGELSLDGSILTLPQELALTEGLFAGQAEPSLVILPAGAGTELKQYFSGIIYADNLQTLVNMLKKDTDIIRKKVVKRNRAAISQSQIPEEVLFLNYDLQAAAWRARQIAVAGGHHLLMQGSQGSGKSSFARASRYLLPDLNNKERYENVLKYSTLKLDYNSSDLNFAIFREPHFTSTKASLLGGSSKYPLGELALADKGIVFLDEINQFSTASLNSMRMAVEDHYIERLVNGENIVRPSRFVLIAAGNPCPCGNLFEKEKKCICTDGEILRYQRKLHTPFFDRFSLFVAMLSVDKDKLSNSLQGPEIEFEKYRDKVKTARLIQSERYQNQENALNLNGFVSLHLLQKSLALAKSEQNLFDSLANKFSLSVRAYQSVLRVARTIADLEMSAEIKAEHIYEAFSYRRRENSYAGV